MYFLCIVFFLIVWYNKNMLKNLDIQNVALIDNLSIDFAPNLTVMTGETGAGKSIIIDSLCFVLGEKANKGLIKQGRDYMKVVACFSSPFVAEVENFLHENDIDFDDEIVLSRKLTCDGKGELRINGEVVSATSFKKLSVLLVDINGQHEHQKLLNEKYHLGIVDLFIKNGNLFLDYKKCYEMLQNINKQISSLNGSTQNQERMLDLLSYQIKEIEDAKIEENEDELLTQKKILMQNSGKIYDNLAVACSNFDGNSSIVDGLKSAISSLNSIVKYDESLNTLIERLENLKYEAMDIASNLIDKKDSCNFDESEFEEIDSRLDKIKLIKRKYGATLQDVFDFLKQAKDDYEKILNSRETLEKLLVEKEKILNELYKKALLLGDARRKVAYEFEKKTNEELKDLGMKNAKFKVAFNDIPSRENFENELNTNGFDKVRFMFSANLGQDLRPLSDIISGGEASRFMLALKNILADVDNVSLMVFDEIDSGISGEIAYKVGCKIANISRRHQVVSVSHLPIICAMADKNLFVQKFTTSDNTSVRVKSLVGDEILEEIARLSGGAEHSANSLLHAKEMKDRCDNYKSEIK